MKVENIYNTDTNYAKIHCEQCAKTLKLIDLGLVEFTPAILSSLDDLAIIHKQRHPKHNPNIYIYHRRPTLKELRG